MENYSVSPRSYLFEYVIVLMFLISGFVFAKMFIFSGESLVLKLFFAVWAYFSLRAAYDICTTPRWIKVDRASGTLYFMSLINGYKKDVVNLQEVNLTRGSYYLLLTFNDKKVAITNSIGNLHKLISTLVELNKTTLISKI